MLAGAAVVCVLVGGYIMVTVFQNETQKRHVTNIINLGEQAKVNEEFVFGDPDKMAGTNQLFISEMVLSDKLKHLPAENNKAVGIVYTLVERDSDGDGKLTNKDIITLSTSNVDGTQCRKLIEGIEQLYSVKQIVDNKVLVLYQKNKQVVSELYSVPSMMQLSQHNIQQINLK